MLLKETQSGLLIHHLQNYSIHFGFMPHLYVALIFCLENSKNVSQIPSKNTNQVEESSDITVGHLIGVRLDAKTHPGMGG
jgi:hypothetical protein